jgi:ketosteroid isomerase-like protein
MCPQPKKIADFEADLGQAMIHMDIATLSKLVGERLDYPKRQRRDGHKAGFINDVQSGALVVTSFKLHDLHIHVIGNVAFVQGFDDEKSSYKGKDNSGTYNWLDVWENRDGRWVSVATQLTKVEANH